MGADRQAMSEARKAFFKQVFSSGSVAGGIIQAVRPNEAVPWDEAEDTRRSDNTVASFVGEYEEAVKKLSEK